MSEVRCPSCGHLLFKFLGLGCIIEIVCTRCKAVVKWPKTEAEVTQPSRK
jgi:phage FluMu protein Com